MFSFITELKYKWLLKRAPEDQKRSIIGKYGESKTARFITKKGFKLLQRNWRYKHGEIDLIAKDKNCLVFIEVRTRNNQALVTGIHTISSKKQHSLKKTAHAYLNQIKSKPEHWRFDVSEVELDTHSNKLSIMYRESVLFN